MDIRYVAGLFDGEGMVSVTKWAKPGSTHIRYQLRVSIGMSHRPIIEALHAKFGGSLHNNRHDLRSSKNRIQFNWIASSQIAATFLRKVIPHLVVKRDEAELALAMQAHIDSNPYTRRVGRGAYGETEAAERALRLAYREDLYQRITALKKRSYPPLTT